MTKKWASYLLVGLLVLVGGGTGLRMVRNSVVLPETRFNLVYIDQEGRRLSVVSFDPVEQKITYITYPEKLAITSRSVGEYEVGNLYTLGAYKNEGGEFARRKVQGFMRLPIVGYLVRREGAGEIDRSFEAALAAAMVQSDSEDNLTALDAYRLWKASRSYSSRQVEEGELMRAGVIVRKEGELLRYAPLALSSYVGQSFFDWGVGKEGATVAVINESGEEGLGSDMAEFLDNMGLDVITVRSGEGTGDKTTMLVREPKVIPQTLRFMEQVFRFDPYTVGDTAMYRAEIVLRVGRDALELF